MEYPGFMQLLGEIPERDEAWKELFAGLLVVRLAYAAFHDMEAGPEGLRVVRQAIRCVGDLREVRRFGRMVAAAGATARDWSANDILSGMLMSYVVLLHERGHLPAVVDACSALIESPIDDIAIRLSATQRRAFAFRDAGQYDKAEADYRALGETSRLMRDHRMRRRADLGLAKVMGERGNIQAAAPMFTAIRDEAEQAGDVELLGLALLDLAVIAGIQKDYRGVVTYSRQALEHITDGWQRERCYVNIAAASRDMGDTVAASQYAALVRETGINADIRARAGVILYQVAIDTQNDNARDAAREWLESATLPPRVECEFRETVAYERATDGAFGEAISAVQAMLDIAEGHRIAEMVIRADAALVHLRRRRVPPLYVAEVRSATAWEPRRGRALLRLSVRHAQAAAENIAAGARLVLAGAGD